MKKHILWFTLLLALLFSACSRQSNESGLDDSSLPQESPTAITIQPITPEPGLVSSEPGCTVISPVPTPGPTVQALFPAPVETDWMRGPLTAAVTILEYSDFQ